MSERMKMLKEVAICADKFPKKTKSLGEIAAEEFPYGVIADMQAGSESGDHGFGIQNM